MPEGQNPEQSAKLTEYEIPSFAKAVKVDQITLDGSLAYRITLESPLAEVRSGSLYFILMFVSEIDPNNVNLLVINAGKTPYNSNPLLSAGDAAIVRLKDFKRIESAEWHTHGSIIEVKVLSSMLNSFRLSRLLSFYLPPDINEETLVVGLSQRPASWLEFAETKGSVMSPALIPQK